MAFPIPRQNARLRRPVDEAVIQFSFPDFLISSFPISGFLISRSSFYNYPFTRPLFPPRGWGLGTRLCGELVSHASPSYEKIEEELARETSGGPGASEQGRAGKTRLEGCSVSRWVLIHQKIHTSLAVLKSRSFTRLLV